MVAVILLVTLLAAAAGLCLGLLLGQRMEQRRYGDLRDEVRDASAAAVAASSQQVFAMADAKLQETERVVAPVQSSLATLTSQLGSLAEREAAWQAQLREQVESVRSAGDGIRRETQSLAEALRRPHVRGQWGELQLRRSLEIAGLTRHCTFEEQVSNRSDDGLIRPDAVIRMPEGRCVVIDSKVPLEAFLSTGSAKTAAEREEHLRRHAQQVRQHIDTLSGKAYWRQFESSPDFVVMFLPSEAIFAQALVTDPTLLEYATRKSLVLATPTTLIAMLRTIGHAWTQQAVADNTREIHRTATELYERLAIASGYLDKLGRSLGTAVGSYNQFVGSLETRVLVSARRLHDLDVGTDAVESPQPREESVRPLTAPELVVGEEPVAITGPPGQEQWVRRAVGE